VAKSKQSGKIQTVTGLIAPEQLGITITHEHLLVDLAAYLTEPEEASERAWIDAPLTMDRLGGIMSRWSYNKVTGRIYDVEVAIDEALKYRYAGGVSLVDATSMGLARDPKALAKISRATGLNIITGGSWYVPLAHPADMDSRTQEQLTEKIVRDVTEGVGDTGVKSGLIGEVGNFHPLTENERKVLRASAHAQVETGAPIMIHPGVQDWAPHEIIEILAESGANPRKVIMAHLGMVIKDRGAMKALAQTGCFLEFDHMGVYEDSNIKYMGKYVDKNTTNDIQQMDQIEFLAENGFAGQVLVSHDANFNHQLTKYGGKGIAHILDNVVPRMRKRGFDQALIDKILIDNPKRALTFA